jgi:DNA-binding GntR family transcriptional regulator
MPKPGPHKTKKSAVTRISRPADSVERAYDAVKSMAIDYKLKPGEPVREHELARALKVSRTPIREALNRLVMEGLLTFVPNRGFFCRQISHEEVRALYETRVILELGAMRLGLQRSTKQEIDDACDVWDTAAARSKSLSAAQLAEADEAFHRAIANLAKNPEIVKALEHINTRVRFFRKIANENPVNRKACFQEHATLIDAIRRRDVETAAKHLQAHLAMSSEAAAEITKEGLAKIYLNAA